MKLTKTISALAIVVALAISGCSKSDNPIDDSKPAPPVSNNYPKPKNLTEMSGLLTIAIKAFTNTVYFDMSAMNVADNQIEITASNAYNNVINNDASLKYAYQVVSIYNKNAKVLKCDIKYMPYKLGIDPNTVPTSTKKVNSYNDLITAVSSSPLGQDIPIAITNKNLDFNTMQLVLGNQCGYGYIVHSFNADATTVKSAPAPMGLPGAPTGMNDCISRINAIKDSVNHILARIITPGMTNDQKLTAVYNYVTPALYDFSYNTPNLNFDSQTALGVFKNKLAVCGGFSWAFYMLANAAGVQCYNVGGSAGATPIGHAWSMANYNGGYFYFDATWDRGRTFSNYSYFAKTEAYFLQNLHTWNNTMINALVTEKL
ncbi:transglutaminase domain-containing protein [Sphingobacterium lumbrici]|uniref:transglutaminase domain-containing protein n=1 Tax=Sphingobacterium lumbrici TaxID=2559600 RepID=UPI001127A50F|nr:transglutaminase domain-containing protein [Sphingobacterium lumbrici]